jgi:acetyl-CoA acetyltransferase
LTSIKINKKKKNGFKMSDNIYIVGVGMLKFGKNFEKSVKQMTGETLDAALKDSNLNKSDIEAAWFSNTGWGSVDIYGGIGQSCIRAQVALFANGLDKIPMNNVENACASGSNALHNAWTSVKAGLFDCCLAVGTEKMYNPPSKTRPAPTASGFLAGTDVEHMGKMIEGVKKQTIEANKKIAKEKGIKIPEKKNRSPFMDFYAAGARNHMKQHGTTQRQLAAIASKNHNNSVNNPYAQYTFPQTIEQVMNDYVVAYPLTRAMCAPIGDGSASAIICSEKFITEKHPELKDRAAIIRGSVLKSGSMGPENVTERCAGAAYKMSGLGPEDINVAECHDATAYAELHEVEALGFCKVGEGGPFAENGETAIGGKIPMNPSGGLLSRGHPIGASGIAQIFELVTQLRGEAGKRQVNDPRYALAQNGGGSIGSGSAAMCVHILERT